MEKKQLTHEKFDEELKKRNAFFTNYIIDGTTFGDNLYNNFFQSYTEYPLKFHNFDFNDWIDEHGTEFKRELIFSECTFNSFVSFEKVAFLEGSNFKKCIFKDKVLFNACVFQNSIAIIDSESSSSFYLGHREKDKKVNITGGFFYWNNNFQNALIKNCEIDYFIYVDVNFYNNSFQLQNCNFLKFGLFRKINFNLNSKFIDCNLTNTSFLHSSISNAFISNCKFDFKGLLDENLMNEKYKKNINDYVSQYPKRVSDLSDFTYENIIEEYRNFETYFDKQKEYNLAGEFHKKRFELDRLYSKKSLKKLLLTLYKWSSDYGENYARSLFLFIIFFLSFTVLFLFPGIDFYENGIKIYKISFIGDFEWKNLGHLFLYSLNNIVPFKKDLDFIKPTTGFTIFLSMVETFVSLILASLFVIGLRRKFKR